VNNLHLTAALAREHRAQLLREAEQYRRVRAAKSGPLGPHPSAWATRWDAWLGRTFIRAGHPARTQATAMMERSTLRQLVSRESSAAECEASRMSDDDLAGLLEEAVPRTDPPARVTITNAG
jgi:hypothetical protein